MPLALRYRAHCEVGLVRRNNQDSAYVSPTMLMVADGMGGAAAGDLASAVAIRELKAADGTASGEAMLAALGEAIDRAGEAMVELVDADPALDGMGSTVCGVMFDGSHLGVANIGDSRAYRYRDGVLTRITRDHSWVQTLVDDGRITEAEALEHPHRSLILKVINGQPQHQPDLELAEARAGDRLLICSDGLCGLVTDDAIAAHLDADLDASVSQLVNLAHEAGAHDNITVILADIVEGDPEGVPQVLGAASLLDLDTLEVTAPVPMLGEPAPAPLPVEVLRYTPLTRRRASSWVRLVLAVLVPVLLLGGAGTVWYLYSQQQYYVGAAAENLAVFQGIPEPVFDLPLSRVIETDQTLIADLPPYYQVRVLRTIPAESLDDARQTVSELRFKAKECIAQRAARQTATAVPSVTETASAPATTPGATPGTTPEANPTTAASPVSAPTPSETLPPAPMEC